MRFVLLSLLFLLLSARGGVVEGGACGGCFSNSIENKINTAASILSSNTTLNDEIKWLQIFEAEGVTFSIPPQDRLKLTFVFASGISPSEYSFKSNGDVPTGWAMHGVNLNSADDRLDLVHGGKAFKQKFGICNRNTYKVVSFAFFNFDTQQKNVHLSNFVISELQCTLSPTVPSLSVTSVLPDDGIQPGTIITIRGSPLNLAQDVFLGGSFKLEKISTSKTEIVYSIPIQPDERYPSSGANDLSLKIGDEIVGIKQAVNVAAQGTITKVAPNNTPSGTIITVAGKHLLGYGSLKTANISTESSSSQATIVDATSSQVILKLPSSLKLGSSSIVFIADNGAVVRCFSCINITPTPTLNSTAFNPNFTTVIPGHNLEMEQASIEEVWLDSQSILNFKSVNNTALTISTLRGPLANASPTLTVKWSNGIVAKTVLKTQHIGTSPSILQGVQPTAFALTFSATPIQSSVKLAYLGGTNCTVYMTALLTCNENQSPFLNSNLNVEFSNGIQAVAYDVLALGPSLQSITPRISYKGSTVTISGAHLFDQSNFTAVLIAGIRCSILSAANDTMVVRLGSPEDVSPANASALGPAGPIVFHTNTARNALVSLFDFTYVQPIINGLSHNTLYGDGEVFVLGIYLMFDNSTSLVLEANGQQLLLTSVSRDSIGFVVGSSTGGFIPPSSGGQVTFDLKWDKIVVASFSSSLFWEPSSLYDGVIFQPDFILVNGTGLPMDLTSTLVLENENGTFELAEKDAADTSLRFYDNVNYNATNGTYLGSIVFDKAFHLPITTIEFVVRNGAISLAEIPMVTTQNMTTLSPSTTTTSGWDLEVQQISPSTVVEGSQVTITMAAGSKLLSISSNISVRMGVLRDDVDTSAPITQLLRSASSLQTVKAVVTTSTTIDARVPMQAREGSRLLVVVSTSVLSSSYSTSVLFDRPPSIVSLRPPKWEAMQKVKIEFSSDVNVSTIASLQFQGTALQVDDLEVGPSYLFVLLPVPGRFKEKNDVVVVLDDGVVVRIHPELDDICYCPRAQEFGLTWYPVVGCEVNTQLPCGRGQTGFTRRPCTRKDRFGTQDSSQCESAELTEIAQRPVRRDNIETILDEFHNVSSEIIFSGSDVRNTIRLVKNCTDLLHGYDGKLSRRTFSLVFGAVNSMLSFDQNVLKNVTDGNVTVKSTTNLVEEWSKGLVDLLGDDEASVFSSDNMLVSCFKFGSNPTTWSGVANMANGECNETCGVQDALVETSMVGSVPMNYSLHGDVPLRSVSIVVFATSILFAESAVANLQDNTTEVAQNATFINSPVLSIQVEHSDNSSEFTGTVVFDLPLVLFEREEETLCSFWIEKWETYGCEVVSINTETVTCSCTHLTNFALLVKKSSGEGAESSSTHNDVLSYISYIGLGLSSVCLLATLLLFLFNTELRKDITRQILSHICFTLLVAILLFLFGFERNSSMSDNQCTVVGVLLHYFLLSAFCWMLVEGYLYYLRFAVVFVQNTMSDKQKHIRFMLFSYLLPLLLVGITMAIFSPSTYESEDICWLNYGNNSIWMFVGPIIVIIAVNLFFFYKILKEVLRIQSRHNSSAKENAKQAVRASATFMVVMGIAWILSAFPLTLTLEYLFVILNSFQGVLIFLFHVLFNRAVRDILSGRRRRETVKRARTTGARYTSSHQKKSRFSQSDSTLSTSMSMSKNEDSFAMSQMGDTLLHEKRHNSLFETDEDRRPSMQKWITDTMEADVTSPDSTVDDELVEDFDKEEVNEVNGYIDVDE
eukprot:m.186575 g.186575  ORF g.186575 m.186575 type:complete len:1754 (-) comp13616_c0_seq1:294-5555(-)